MMVGLIYYRKSKTERKKEKMTNLWICQGFFLPLGKWNHPTQEKESLLLYNVQLLCLIIESSFVL